MELGGVGFGAPERGYLDELPRGSKAWRVRHWGATLLEFLHLFAAPGNAMRGLAEVRADVQPRRSLSPV